MTHTHRLELTVVERRLFVIEGREAHALEVPPVPLLAPHHDPHRSPLRDVHRLDDARDLVHEGDGAGDVVQHLTITLKSIKI